jgi:NADH-quinone oxidoreductase subunit L
MPKMGGLRRKMPYTAATMLVGCLAIAGAGIPTVIGLSGFHSKDYIIAQALSFYWANPRFGGIFYYAALSGAALTAFYMFRLWFMTFAGQPRDGYVYHHAHESPRVMTVPLMILAVPAIMVAWNVPGTKLGLEPLLRQAQPPGIARGISGGELWPGVTMPGEHANAEEAEELSFKAEWAAFLVAFGGFSLATLFYGLRKLDAEEARRYFAPIYQFLVHKWWFDELYWRVFVRPMLWLSRQVAALDQRGIDRLADGSARAVAALARLDDWIDRIFVDAFVNFLARRTYAIGLKLRAIQTGSIRQYVMWVAVGTVSLFVLMNLYWNYAIAGR